MKRNIELFLTLIANWLFDLIQNPDNQLTITCLIFPVIKNDYKNNKNLPFPLIF